MKILLRKHDEDYYVWQKATYRRGKFFVNGVSMYYNNIVSVMNDTRHNHIQCSSCGAVFPKNGKKFHKHREASEGIGLCLTCNCVQSWNEGAQQIKYIDNGNGTFTKKIVGNVKLMCNKHPWHSHDITSPIAISQCERRQCKDAVPLPIVDVFTKFPGVFDDIITVDTIIANGYEEIVYKDKSGTEYLLSRELDICAWVNAIGIVESFIINGTGEYGDIVYYSKKYNKLFTDCADDYVEYKEDDAEDALKFIARFYK